MSSRHAERRAEQALADDDAAITPLGTRSVMERSGNGALSVCLPKEVCREQGIGGGGEMKVGHVPALGAFLLIPTDEFDGWQ